MNDESIVTCVYCGQAYPPGTPTSQHELLTAHIKVCEKHPMREKEEEITKALKVLRDAADGALDDAGLVEACCIIASQRDNARNEGWRPLRVDYGRDTGLVEMNRGLLIMSTWDTSRVSTMSDVPKVVVEDHEMMELFGDEHSWDDVIDMLQQHYCWERKVLPDMDELRKRYQGRDRA